MLTLDKAEKWAAALLDRFVPEGYPPGFVAGSVRRQVASPGDIELVLPLASSDAPGASDGVYSAVASMTKLKDRGPGGLFDPPSAGPPRFEEVQGLKPGFRSARLVELTEGVQIDLFRYVPGPRGNLGWILLMRTGSGEFSHKALCWHKLNLVGGDEEAVKVPGWQGSRDGFLVDLRGVPIPTPTEERCFEVMRMAWLPPQERRDGRDVVRASTMFARDAARRRREA